MNAKLGRAGWRISSYSSNGDSCVDVNLTHAGAEIRHSKVPSGPSIAFTATQWDAWLLEIVAPRLTNTNGAVLVEPTPEGWIVRAVRGEAVIVFTSAEIEAFRRGVLDGEFSRAAVLTTADALVPVA